jgi:aminopeptidase N
MRFNLIFLIGGIIFGNSLSLFAQHPCSDYRVKVKRTQPVVSAKVSAAMMDYDVSFYKLDLAMERTNTNVAGSATHKSRVTASTLSSYVFELHPNFTIDSIQVNQTNVAFTRSGNSVTAQLNSTANQGDWLDVQIWYNGTAPNSGQAAIGNGLSNGTSQSWGNRVTWSLSQPYAAYEWWPCKQNLTDKADSCMVIITTDSTNKAGSNGLLIQTQTIGSKKRYTWKSNYPIDYYLISVSIAKYVEYSFYANPVGSANPVLIQNYIYDNPQTLPNFQADIDETKDMMELFATLFGPYPFDAEKYGHCMAPFSGGMEHQTMTTQGFFTFELTAHELGHQWFGDHVTCATWSDIWVNEGFASYSEYLALQGLHPADAAPHMQDVHDNVMSLTDGSIWFTDTTQVNRIFSSRLTYNKGSAVLHMIRFELNDDTVFFRVLKKYQQQFANGNATAIDFKQLLETESGKNFTTFFNQWFYGEGYPTFSAKWFHKNGVFYLQSSQSPSAPTVTPLFETPLEFKLTRGGGQDTIIRLSLAQSSDFFTLPVGGNVSFVSIDPNNWVLNQVGTVTKDSSILQFASNESTLTNEDWVDFGVNPFQDYISLQVLAGVGDGIVRVMDTQGKLLIQAPMNQGNLRLNTSSIPVGNYIVEYESNSGQKYSKHLIKVNP